MICKGVGDFMSEVTKQPTLLEQMTTEGFVDESLNLMYTAETAKRAPQGRINNEFDAIMAKSYAETDTSEHEVLEQPTESNERLSLRQRAAKKLGSYATETKIAFNISGGNPFSLAHYGAKKASDKLLSYRKGSEHSKRPVSKVKTALASTALLGVAGAGAYAAYKSGIDHDTIVDAFDNAPVVETDYTHDVLTYNLSPEHTTNLIVGGRGDTDGNGLHGLVHGASGFEAAHTVKVDYPAEIAPMPGDTLTLNESSEIAAQKVYDHLTQNGTDKTHLVVYSQGTQGGMEGLARYVAENGGTLPPNIEVTVMASPNTPGSGVFHDDIVKQFTPLFENLGIDMRDADLPDGAKGVTFIAGQNDLFANSGEGRNVLRKLGNAADFIGGGDGHSMDGFNDPSRHIVNEVDGNTYVTIKPEGTQNPILRLAEMHGAAVSPEADRAFEAWMPAGEVGKVAPAVNVDHALDTSADAIRRVLDDNHIAYDPTHFEIVKNLPIGQEIQQGVNDLLNLNFTPSAPDVPALAQAPAVSEVPAVAQPVLAPEIVPPAPAPATIVPQPVEQIQQTVNNFVQQPLSAPAPVAVPALSVPTFEVPSEVVNQISEAVAPHVAPQHLEMAQDFLGQFAPQ